MKTSALTKIKEARPWPEEITFSFAGIECLCKPQIYNTGVYDLWYSSISWCQHWYNSSFQSNTVVCLSCRYS